MSHKRSSLLVESAEIVRATEKPKSARAKVINGPNGSNQFMLQLSNILSCASHFTPLVIYVHIHVPASGGNKLPQAGGHKRSTRTAANIWSRSRLEVKLQCWRRTKAEGDRSRQSQPRLIAVALCPMKAPPPPLSRFYHADFDKESPARWLSPAAPQGARSSGAKSKQWHR